MLYKKTQNSKLGLFFRHDRFARGWFLVELVHVRLDPVNLGHVAEFVRVRVAPVGILDRVTVPVRHQLAFALFRLVRRAGPVRPMRVTLRPEERVVLDHQLRFASLSRRERPLGKI